MVKEKSERLREKHPFRIGERVFYSYVGEHSSDYDGKLESASPCIPRLRVVHVRKGCFKYYLTEELSGSRDPVFYYWIDQEDVFMNRDNAVKRANRLFRGYMAELRGNKYYKKAFLDRLLENQLTPSQ